MPVSVILLQCAREIAREVRFREFSKQLERFKRVGSLILGQRLKLSERFVRKFSWGSNEEIGLIPSSETLGQSQKLRSREESPWNMLRFVRISCTLWLVRTVDSSSFICMVFNKESLLKRSISFLIVLLSQTRQRESFTLRAVRVVRLERDLARECREGMVRARQSWEVTFMEERYRRLLILLQRI